MKQICYAVRVASHFACVHIKRPFHQTPFPELKGELVLRNLNKRLNKRGFT